MPLCVSWESLLKGGLLPFLKETALPNPPRPGGIALLPKSLPPPKRKGPWRSSSPPNHPCSSPGGAELTPPQGCGAGGAGTRCPRDIAPGSREPRGSPAFR